MSVKNAIDPVLNRLDQTAGSAKDTVKNAQNAYDEGRRAVPEIARSTQKAINDGVDQFRSQTKDMTDAAGDQIDTARLYMVERVQERRSPQPWRRSGRASCSVCYLPAIVGDRSADRQRNHSARGASGGGFSRRGVDCFRPLHPVVRGHGFSGGVGRHCGGDCSRFGGWWADTAEQNQGASVGKAVQGSA